MASQSLLNANMPPPAPTTTTIFWFLKVIKYASSNIINCLVDIFRIGHLGDCWSWRDNWLHPPTRRRRFQKQVTNICWDNDVMILGENILTENDVRFKCSGRLPLQITVFLLPKRKIALYLYLYLYVNVTKKDLHVNSVLFVFHFGTENREEQLKWQLSNAALLSLALRVHNYFLESGQSCRFTTASRRTSHLTRIITTLDSTRSKDLALQASNLSFPDNKKQHQI